MSGILCATRGGSASEATVNSAIDLAREMDLPLSFLYVVNLDFLSRTSSSRVRTIKEEMFQMGESILIAAQDEARSRGIAAKRLIRHGKVGDEIVKLCQDLDVDYLVLGRPETEGLDNVFSRDSFSEFVRSLESQTGARVVLPGGKP
jgi:nucleotide-binding universal stress UspA family protein